VYGMGSIPAALVRAGARAGVTFRLGARVTDIRTEKGRVTSVTTADSETFDADAVVSNHSAIGTYVKLLDSVQAQVRRRAEGIPLQSPGVCAYLAVNGGASSPYLRFLLPETGRCRLLITPSGDGVDGWRPARLLGPMDFVEAERLGVIGQQAYLDGLLAETWWQDLDDFRVLSRRVPAQWGSEFHLYRDCMNPVMTAKFMRQGRFAHRSPHVGGLYLAGSSTHPGQWVSFCAISGILAADSVIEDLC
jgi:phytoene dehydrogenase-like protein